MTNRASPQTPWADDPILADGGACGALLRAHDWAASPLGEPKHWPQELRVLVSLMLGSMQPGVIVWAEDGIALYNDGFAAMLGERHPRAFGQPFRSIWGPRWPEVEEALNAACAGSGSRLDEFTFERQQAGEVMSATYAFALTPVRTPQGDVMGVFCACVETTWQFIARRDAAAETARLKAMFQHAPGAIAITSGPGHVYELTNNAFEKLIGRSVASGENVRTALPSETSEKFFALLDQVYRSGKPYVGEGQDVEFLPTTPGAASRRRMIDFVLQPVRDAHGIVTGIFTEVQDVTERTLAEKQQELLNREIAHRMKNQLAVVNGIVSQTLRSSDDVAAIKKTLSARISALARAQTALVNKPGGATRVGDVVAAFLDVHGSGDGRIVTRGPDTRIGAQPSLSLTLILHELGTNATKHGALSRPEGRIAIDWSVETAAAGGQRFRFEWRETGGPAVTPPAKPSAGTRLIRAGLSGTRDCTVDLDYRPEGLVCIIAADFQSVTGEAG